MLEQQQLSFKQWLENVFKNKENSALNEYNTYFKTMVHVVPFKLQDESYRMWSN